MQAHTDKIIVILKYKRLSDEAFHKISFSPYITQVESWRGLDSWDSCNNMPFMDLEAEIMSFDWPHSLRRYSYFMLAIWLNSAKLFLYCSKLLKK